MGCAMEICRQQSRQNGRRGVAQRGVVHAQVPLRQHLLKVAVAERESQIPADARDGDLAGRVATLPQKEPPHDGQELERHKRGGGWMYTISVGSKTESRLKGYTNCEKY
jgi:hypothetical protein